MLIIPSWTWAWHSSAPACFQFYLSTSLKVTSDIHQIALIAGHFSFFFFYSGIMLRSIFSFLPFNVIFANVEAMKISFTQVVAVFNVSAAVQLSIILNFDWVQKYKDNVIIQISTVFIFLHLSFPAVEYVLVS